MSKAPVIITDSTAQLMLDFATFITLRAAEATGFKEPDVAAHLNFVAGQFAEFCEILGVDKIYMDNNEEADDDDGCDDDCDNDETDDDDDSDDSTPVSRSSLEALLYALFDCEK